MRLLAVILLALNVVLTGTLVYAMAVGRKAPVQFHIGEHITESFSYALPYSHGARGDLLWWSPSWLGTCALRIATDRDSVITEITTLSDTWGACSRAL